MNISFLSVLVLSCFLFSPESEASYLKASAASGANDYRDFALAAKWSIKDAGRILTSVQSSNTAGSVTNEFKFGYDDSLNDIASYVLNGYFRKEPGDVSVVGLEPEISFDYDSLIFDGLTTGFAIGLELSRSSTRTQITPLRSINESFTTGGISLSVNQELVKDLKASLGASFYRYTEPQTRFASAKRKQILLLASDNGLSSSGYPDRTFTFGLAWDFVEKWSANYYASRTKSHFESSTVLYSGVGLDHNFSDTWAAGISYSWNSASASTGGLDLTCSW